MELELLLEKGCTSCKVLFKSRRKQFEHSIYGIQYFSFIILEKSSGLWKCCILQDTIQLLRFQFDHNVHSVWLHLYQKCFTFLLYESFDIVPVVFMKFILVVVETMLTTTYLLMRAKLNPIIDLFHAFFIPFLHKVNSIDTDWTSCRVLLSGWQHMIWKCLSILLMVMSSL